MNLLYKLGRSASSVALAMLLALVLYFLFFAHRLTDMCDRLEALRNEDNTAPLVVSRPQALQQRCPVYNELLNINFLHSSIRRDICEGVRAYAIFDGAFPLCILNQRLPQILTDTVKSNSHETFIVSPASKRRIPCYVYSMPDAISIQIHRYHRFKARNVRTVQEIIQKAAAKMPVTFLDVGANLGAYTLPVLDLGVPVVALDANIRNLMRLKLSAEAANRSHQLRLLWNFINRRVSLMYLNFPEDCNVGGATKFHRAVEDTIPVMSSTADAIAPTIQTDTVVMKVDIEGGEAEFFKSAGALFDRFTVPVVHMEWLRRHMSEEERSFVIKFLLERQYVPRDPLDLKHVFNVDVANFEAENMLWVRKDFVCDGSDGGVV